MIDGEHYPSVIEAALARLRQEGAEIAAAVMAGGREKLPEGGLDQVAGVPLRYGPHPARLLAETLDEVAPDAVLDLSDDPVLDYRRRHELASIALHRGVRYEGAGFAFDPPRRPRLCQKPSIAVIGTGKRTGKTAVSTLAARSLVAAGWGPAVVAMGRGGPPDPVVVPASAERLDPEALVALADAGRHAASDYIEDSVLAQVPTVGCWRCGSGIAGDVEFSNVEQGVALANDLPGKLLLLEGSGSAIPPVHADVTCLVVPANIEPEYLRGYFGPYRMLLSDVVMVTMCEKPFASPSQISSIVGHIRDIIDGLGNRGAQGEIRVAATVLRPAPSDPLEGATVFVATTAPEAAGDQIKSYLEAHEKCRVVAMTHSLSNRSQLERELKAMEGADVLLCEIKAAGVDVAMRRVLEAGMRVSYLDNVPEAIDGQDLRAVFESAAELANIRFGTA